MRPRKSAFGRPCGCCDCGGGGGWVGWVGVDVVVLVVCIVCVVCVVCVGFSYLASALAAATDFSCSKEEPELLAVQSLSFGPWVDDDAALFATEHVALARSVGGCGARGVCVRVLSWREGVGWLCSLSHAMMCCPLHQL